TDGGMKWTCTSTSPGTPSPRHQAGTSTSSTASEIAALGAPAHGAADLAVGVAAGQVLALVVGALPARQGQFDLHLARAEVESQRDERQAALARLAEEPVDLVAVQQQLAHPTRLVVGPRAVDVLRDVHAVQEDLAVVDGRE